MRRLSLALTLALTPAVLPAQQSPSRPGTTPPLEIGAVAPDFSLHGATRYGVLATPGPSLRLQGQDGRPGVLLQGPNQRLNGPNERVP